MDVAFEIRELRFVWDSVKAASNLIKHGVAFPVAAEVFLDPGLVMIDDPAHSLSGQRRYTGIGFTFELRLLRVTFRSLPGDVIRIISAREALEPERRRYARENR